VIDLVARRATEYGLSLPEVSVEDMKADLALLQRLRPLIAAVDSLHQTLSDTSLHDGWHSR
jgi:hypothetical protein